MKARALLLLCLGALPVYAEEPSNEEEGEVIRVEGTTTPGSEFTVDSAELERFERDDVHQVLTSVPGVYVRQEDGYGLRPNIGMRGSGSERSAKIGLLEDGVPIAPAPYSAPAAYYFPLITRMQRIEVLKGPSAILYGPNTVGGTINMISRPVPDHWGSFVDIAGGQDRYGKLHTAQAIAGKRLGLMIEAAKLRSDGFKHIDGGGATGFDKHDINLKLRWNSDPSAPRFHRLDAAFGYADEHSNETYTGLSRADLAADPYRRYAATRLDRFYDDQQRLRLGYEFENGSGLRLSTQFYHQQFDRVWRKLNGFADGTDLSDVLANPMAGSNAVYYSVLTGASDSTGDSDTLMIGTNDRSFLSQGIQTSATYPVSTFGLQHELLAGLRLHRDRAKRLHTEDGHDMIGGRLVPDGLMRTTRDATGAAQALATFVRDKLSFGKFEISAGVRFELIRTEWRDRGTPDASNKDVHAVWIPGAGVHYQVLPWLGLLAGVHKGFVPGAPAPEGTADPEESINYEAGARIQHDRLRVDAIGFWNDYQNLKGSCTFSSGCMEGLIDNEFAGGAVDVYGLEAHVEADVWRARRFTLPVSASYTLTRSMFRTGFRSQNPQWGTVEPGDELPYLPSHQLAVTVGARNNRFDVFLTGRYTGAMRDVAGQGPVAPEAEIPASRSVDAAAHLFGGRLGQLYTTVTNIFDEASVVSLRPFGARPGAPRTFIFGYKNDF